MRLNEALKIIGSISQDCLVIEFFSRAECNRQAIQQIINAWNKNRTQSIQIRLVEKSGLISDQITAHSPSDLQEFLDKTQKVTDQEAELFEQQKTLSTSALRTTLEKFLKEFSCNLKKEFKLDHDSDKPQCFFSYAQILKDFPYEAWTEQCITLLKQHLEYAGIKVYLDKVDNTHSASLHKYMVDTIEHVDLVILFGTESLLYKLNSESDFVIQREVRFILDKVDGFSKKWNTSDFDQNQNIGPLITLLLSGQVHSAIPESIRGNFAVQEWNHEGEKKHYLEHLKALILHIYKVVYQLKKSHLRNITSQALEKIWDQCIKKHSALLQCIQRVKEVGFKVSEPHNNCISGNSFSFFCNTNFRFAIPRSNYLTEIKKSYNKQQDIKKPLKGVILAGGGGSGKTILANQYFNEYQGTFNKVVFVQAEHNLAQNLQILAINLNIYSPRYFDEDDSVALRKLVQAIINKLDESECWLLILDNVSKAKELWPFKQIIFGNSGADRNLLITTRSQTKWNGYDWQFIEVLPFTMQEACDYMNYYDLPYQDPLSVKTVCENLGRLPLALCQAVSYCKNTKISLEEYLQRLQRMPVDLFQKAYKTDEYPYPIYQTLMLAFDLLTENKDHDTLKLIKVCIFLNPDDIPRELLRTLVGNELICDLLLSKLLKHSLIRITGNGDNILVHRLIQIFILNKLSKEEFVQTIELLIKSFHTIFEDRGDRAGIDYNNRLFANFVLMAKRVPSNLWQDLSKGVLLLLARNYHVAFCNRLRMFSNSSYCLDYLDMARKILEFLKSSSGSLEDYEEVLAIHKNIRVWTMIADKKYEKKYQDYPKEARMYWTSKLIPDSLPNEKIIRNIMVTTSNHAFLVSTFGIRDELTALKNALDNSLNLIEREEYKAIRINCSHQYAQCYSAKANLLFELGNYEEAELAGKKAFEIFSNRDLFKKLHNNALYVGNRRVLSLIRLDRLTEARTTLKELINLCYQLNSDFKDPTLTREHLKACGMLANMGEGLADPELGSYWRTFEEIADKTNTNVDVIKQGITKFFETGEANINNACML